MDFILANPHVNYSDVAKHFGYTQGWLSQIINSDAFQAQLAEKQVDLFGDLRLTIKDRVVGLAHESLQRLTEKVQTEGDISKLNDVADTALRALGFGGKAPAPAVGTIHGNVTFQTVDAQTLADARKLMDKREERPVPALAAEAVPATQ